MKLDSEIRRHYSRKRLASTDVAELVRMARSPMGRLRHLAPRMAAAALMLFVSVFLINRFTDAPVVAAPELATSIAKHVVFQHEESVPLTVRTENIQELTMELPRLNFTPAASMGVSAERYRLYGARYCHIEGKIAVHMRLMREDGQSVTLYQVADQPEFDAVDGTEIEWKGYRVRMWRENGVLMCLAERITVSA